jgi:hypothetical protein
MMTSSIAKPRASIGMRMLWAIGLLLVLELVPFVVVKLAFPATVRALAGPYLAIAASGVILLLLAWGLRTWEDRGATPGRLALGWSLCVALFTSGLAIGLFYLVAALHLIDPSDLWIAVGAYAAVVVVTSFTMYRMTWARISARAAQ